MGPQSRPRPALWAEVVNFERKVEEIEQQITKVANGSADGTMSWDGRLSGSSSS